MARRNKRHFNIKLTDPRSLSRDSLIRLLTVLFSVVYIAVGYRMVSADLDIFNMEGAYTVKAEVLQIGDADSSGYTAGEFYYEDVTTYFTARVLNGREFKGNTVLAAQTSDNYSNMSADEPVKVGDKVVLYNYGIKQGAADWVFGGYARLDGNIILGGIFVVLLLFFGRGKGLNTIISLVFTCLAVFMVFVPSVLAGFNIYMMTAITCVYTISMTLLITNGWSAKSLTTMLGCSFGVLTAAVLSLIFDRVLRLTGMLDEHSVYLQYLSSGVEINLRAIVFAMIVIGAMGAVMDVAMDISSSLYELHCRAEHLSFAQLYQSGMNIGRDVMGTMANTLVLAYIGSSLCSILILITYSSSLYELLNRENIAVEMMNSLIGSLSILMTIPLTTLVCCFMYKGRDSRFATEALPAGVSDALRSEDAEFRAAADRAIRLAGKGAGSSRPKADNAGSRAAKALKTVKQASSGSPDSAVSAAKKTDSRVVRTQKSSNSGKSIIPDKDPMALYNEYLSKKQNKE